MVEPLAPHEQRQQVRGSGAACLLVTHSAAAAAAADRVLRLTPNGIEAATT